MSTSVPSLVLPTDHEELFLNEEPDTLSEILSLMITWPSPDPSLLTLI